MQLKINPDFKALIPPLSPDERAQLENNILVEGCRDPLVVWGDTLIDGHNRYEICTANGIAFRVVEIALADEDSARDWIVRNQLGRRNLTPEQFRYFLGLRYRREKKEHGERGPQKKADQIDPSFDGHATADRIAAETGTSPATVKRAERFAQQVHSEPELKDALMQGGTIRAAIRDIKRSQHQESLSAPPPVCDSGKYQLVLADPPWRYDHQEAANRAVENQYPTADLETIKQHFPKTEDDAILLLWATAPKLLEALEVMNCWGFRYVTNAVWDKMKIGMGYWFRGQHEMLLVGVKGRPGTVPECERRSSVFQEARGQHSAKPACVYEWIERSFPDRTKLEMYCRSPRKGWTSWGNES